MNEPMIRITVDVPLMHAQTIAAVMALIGDDDIDDVIGYEECAGVVGLFLDTLYDSGYSEGKDSVMDRVIKYCHAQSHAQVNDLA